MRGDGRFFYGWVVVATSALGHAGRGAISLALTFQNSFAAFLAAWIGRLADRWRAQGDIAGFRDPRSGSAVGGGDPPSASNRQSVDIYAVLPEGTCLYNAKEHRLDLAAAGDLRALAGTQDFAASAPLNLVYVGDYSKFANARDEDKATYTGSETGSIGQNVYLYCASEGLATVIRASIDRPALAKALKLRPEQRIVLAQTVGKPK
jgi:nitroreductase